jgi:hypothetical protein
VIKEERSVLDLKSYSTIRRPPPPFRINANPKPLIFGEVFAFAFYWKSNLGTQRNRRPCPAVGVSVAFVFASQQGTMQRMRNTFVSALTKSSQNDQK